VNNTTTNKKKSKQKIQKNYFIKLSDWPRGDQPLLVFDGNIELSFSERNQHLVAEC
jgi:hypothetical protein